MRVISGRLGGQLFDSPPGHRTHPMSDKARGGLFGVLGDIEGLRLLDAYAGSGAIGIEAISRGVTHVTAIESDKSAHRTIESNSAKLRLEPKLKAIHASVTAWYDKNPGEKFDLVVADPPFDNLSLRALQKVARQVVIGGIFVLSFPGKLELPDFQGFELLKSKSYGDNQLAFYRRTV